MKVLTAILAIQDFNPIFLNDTMIRQTFVSHYADGEKGYILHPIRAIIGDTIVSSIEVHVKMGNVYM